MRVPRRGATALASRPAGVPMAVLMHGNTGEAESRPDELALGAAVTRFCAELRITRQRSPKTEKAYRCDLGQLVAVLGADLRVAALARSHVETWLADLRRRDYKTSTVRRKIACVRCFLRHERRRGVLSSDPFESLEVDLGRERQLTRTLVDREFDALLARADREADMDVERSSEALLLAQRNQAMIWLLCGTGLRVGELVELTTRNTDATEGVLRVDGKGRRQRLAFTVDGDRERLARYLQTRSSFRFDHDQVFVNHRGRPITTEGVRAVVAKLARTCGLDRGVTPHMLRHTAATRLLQHGANLRIVQEFLGHSSIRMTERYTHVSAAALREAVTNHTPLKRA